jgi:hypothetical protein
MTNTMHEQAIQRREQAYLALAENWLELVDEADSELWLMIENEALNNVEKLFDDVH